MSYRGDLLGLSGAATRRIQPPPGCHPNFFWTGTHCRPAGTHCHPNSYEAVTQSLFESDQPNERTRNALMPFRVALYDCRRRLFNSERDPLARPLEFLLLSCLSVWYVRVVGTSREAASPPLRQPHCTDVKNLQLPTKIWARIEDYSFNVLALI